MIYRLRGGLLIHAYMYEFDRYIYNLYDTARCGKLAKWIQTHPAETAEISQMLIMMLVVSLAERAINRI